FLHQGKPMRTPVALLATLVLVACGTAPAPPDQPGAPVNPTVEYLLTAAAADFHTHLPPGPVRVRNVRSAYVTAPDGEKQYRVCGEFLSAPEAGATEWMPFATIRTSGYEQYVGGQSDSFCTRPATTWDEGDLSSSLQARLDSLEGQAGT